MAYRIEDGANAFPLRNEVYQSNPLINARKSFDLMGMRIFILGLRGLNPHFSKKDKFFDEEFKETFIPANELTQLFQNTSYLSEMKSACRKLFNTTIEIKNSAGELTLTHIFKKLEYDPSKGLHLKFDEEMRPYLLNLSESGGYTMIKADYLFKLSSPYAVRILELLLQYQNFRMFRELKEVRRKFTVDELRYLLNVPENAYKNRADNFKRYVLDIPIKEITERTPYKVHYKAIKNGRRLYAFEFLLDVFDAPVEILNGQRTYFGETAIYKLCELGFSEKAAQAIYLKCDNTRDCLNRINRARLILTFQKNPIENELGFLRKAIEGNWQLNGKRPPPKQDQPAPSPQIRRKQLLKFLKEDPQPITNPQPEMPEASSKKSKVVELAPPRNVSDAPPPTKKEKPRPEPKTDSPYDAETTRTYTDHQAPTPEAAETKKSRLEESDIVSLVESDSNENSPEAKLAAHKQIFDTLLTIKHLITSTLDARVKKEEAASKNHELSPPLTEEEEGALTKSVEVMDRLPTILALLFIFKRNITPEIIQERKNIITILKLIRAFRTSILATFEVPYEEVHEGNVKLSANIKILENSITMDNNDEMIQLLKPLLNNSDYSSNPFQAIEKFLNSLKSFSNDDEEKRFPGDDSSTDNNNLTSFGSLFDSMKFSSSNGSSSADNISFDTKKQTPIDDDKHFYKKKRFTINDYDEDYDENEDDPNFLEKNPLFRLLPKTDGFHSEEEILAIAEEASRSINWPIRKPKLGKHPTATLPDVSIILATLHYRKYPKQDLTAKDITELAREINFCLDVIEENLEDIKFLCLKREKAGCDNKNENERIFLEGKLTEDLLLKDPAEAKTTQNMYYLYVVSIINVIRVGDSFGSNGELAYFEGLMLKKLHRYFDMTYVDFLRTVIRRLIINSPQKSYELR